MEHTMRKSDASRERSEAALSPLGVLDTILTQQFTVIFHFSSQVLLQFFASVLSPSLRKPVRPAGGETG